MKTRIGLCMLLLVAFAWSAAAAPIEKGSSILAIQLTEGTADLYGGTSGVYISAYDHSEMGAQVQYWYFFRDDYAFNLSGGIGFFKETNEPGPLALPGSEDVEYSQSSWQFRIGGDRVAHLTDTFHIFAGPGIQVWSGKAEFDDAETESVMRFALSARIGVHLKMGESFGLMGHLGHYFGYASAEDGDAKATWWPSGHDGAAGLAFNF